MELTVNTILLNVQQELHGLAFLVILTVNVEVDTIWERVDNVPVYLNNVLLQQLSMEKDVLVQIMLVLLELMLMEIDVFLMFHVKRVLFGIQLI